MALTEYKFTIDFRSFTITQTRTKILWGPVLLFKKKHDVSKSAGLYVFSNRLTEPKHRNPTLNLQRRNTILSPFYRVAPVHKLCQSRPLSRCRSRALSAASGVCGAVGGGGGPVLRAACGRYPDQPTQAIRTMPPPSGRRHMDPAPSYIALQGNTAVLSDLLVVTA